MGGRRKHDPKPEANAVLEPLQGQKTVAKICCGDGIASKSSLHRSRVPADLHLPTALGG